MSRVDVCLGDRRYPVLIGEGGRERDLPRLVHRQARRGGRVFVIFDAQVCALYGPELVARLADSGGSIHQMVLPSGERFKTLSVAAAVYDFLLRRRVARDDFLLAVGGGVTTDLAGYTAATILRGIPWGAVPTTLLGMVDAAIGGKTGVNHPLGKNLIGAFWQPRFVLCDVGFLPTLPDRELVAGLGEVVKYAGLAGETFLRLLESYLDGGNLLEARSLSRLVRLSVAYKAGVVVRDERESGPRMALNLGHTFGHAVEQAAGFGRLRHGEAVLLGLDAAVELSIAQKPSRRAGLAGYRALVRRLLGVLPRRRISAEAVMEALALDKKRAGTTARFVLLDAPGRPLIGTEVPAAAVRDAVRAMLEHYAPEGGRHVQSPRR
ncbi:MAG TPA: 3-dehydroquinate synthase [candidate division Zixibacteria bacterium]|nr:3-dehydroquinate synthase [candidate division Zixibacteria bacterium]MDD4918708.1 3-dehydroquinate synthase [candidate division Zixibacteria bacterium]MDM7973947.1 3-dehydroquinate synthase [candidate division Zixibacteria bacterium]HOD65788.1 3-dehydroquinate synthase [candidate division Zixibacteria bacterium]HOZ06896.1 3-dehydroquinate synthase [candidate division Zixibacteria bacterium]